MPSITPMMWPVISNVELNQSQGFGSSLTPDDSNDLPSRLLILPPSGSGTVPVVVSSPVNVSFEVSISVYTRVGECNNSGHSLQLLPRELHRHPGATSHFNLDHHRRRKRQATTVHSHDYNTNQQAKQRPLRIGRSHSWTITAHRQLPSRMPLSGGRTGDSFICSGDESAFQLIFRKSHARNVAPICSRSVPTS